MESFDDSGSAAVVCGIRKKRSNASRRPRLDSNVLLQSNNLLPPSTQPLSNESYDTNQSNEDKAVLCDGLGSENKLKRLKLKFGGVTHTIHSNSVADKSSSCFTDFTSQEKSLLQHGIDGNHSFSIDRRKGFEVKWKNISRVDSSSRKEHSSRGKFEGSASLNYESVRKSKRIPKRRVLDVGFDDDEDEEIRYLGKLNAAKNPCDREDCGDHMSRSQVMDGLYDGAVGDYGSTLLRKDSKKKSRAEKEDEDIDYLDEEQPSDDEPGYTGKKLKKGSPSLYTEGWKDSIPTTRNRAKDNLDGSLANAIDFSSCLLPSRSRKKKENLSELEQQLKKTEAAQRRRMQSEKAAREAEAEAIRKILGQDSARKKREEKLKKRREEISQGKAANSVTLASNTVRWVSGPGGTIVTFSEDIGLPIIFNPPQSSYPPPREKCAGPNCTNTYKYRDSKSKLPLCSLQCYKAVHKEMQPLVTY
ncbi:hypothetical protein UlMin_009669 [Ulmus minor]